MTPARGISIPLSFGIRGAGLGNEIVPWAKSWIAATELGLRSMKPRWLFNRYGYADAFGWHRRELVRELLRTVGRDHITVTEAMYRSTGCIDYGSAISNLARSEGWQSPLSLRHEGMWGGKLALARARTFLLEQVLSAPGVLASMYRQQSPNPDSDHRIDVAVHFRAGDFLDGELVPGKFNVLLPYDWYSSVLAAFVRAASGTRIRLTLVTDDPGSVVAVRLRDRFNMYCPESSSHSSVLNDLMTLVQADVVICSVSSFSLLASFLSDKPYIWHLPQLTDHEVARSIWGAEPAQISGTTAENLLHISDFGPLYRGYALAEGDPIPEPLMHHLMDIVQLRDRRKDLIYYGVVPK
jgi:hypothetical protein